MKRWKEMNVRFHLGIAAAFALAALALALVYSFNQYKSQIIKEQEEQLLTIAKAVSNSISVYTDFYFADLVDVNTYDEYQTAGRLYLETGEEGPVRKFLTEHMRIQNEDVSNFFSQQRPGERRGARGPDPGRRDRTYTSVNHFDGRRSDSRIDILRDEENQFYLGLSMPTLDGSLRLYFVINIERMYQKVASYIKVGQNGYVMIKDSTGRILMHPVKKQIGKDVISGREAMYPDFDLTELEQLIEHQKRGRRRRKFTTLLVDRPGAQAGEKDRGLHAGLVPGRFHHRQRGHRLRRDRGPHQQGHDQRVLTDNCAYDHLRGGSL